MAGSINKDTVYQDKPIHIHYGCDWHQILITIFLFIIALGSMYLIKFVNFSMLAITIGSVIGILCIRYSRLYVYSNWIEIRKKSPIRKLSYLESISFESTKTIEFIEGSTDWTKFFILASMGKGSYGGSDRVAEASSMKITMKDNSLKFIYKFGEKEHFRNTAALIIKLL